ncbi:MAG: hypothetical protein PHH69_03395 [Candidatus Omnitrophica bacterium]|nr:hypothetical protein [Candidatus Omnitrophota bacterium]
MRVDNWVDELRNQLKSFDEETSGSEIKMADITLGYIDRQGLIHYHKIEYRAKGFEKKPVSSQSLQR